MKKISRRTVIWLSLILTFFSIICINTYYYGLYTPAQIKKYGVYVKRVSYGHSSDFYQYKLLKCGSNEEIQSLSDAVEIDGLDYLFPPVRLIYKNKGGKLYVFIERNFRIGLTWVFDEDSHQFVKISGSGPY